MIKKIINFPEYWITSGGQVFSTAKTKTGRYLKPNKTRDGNICGFSKGKKK